jgi:hypothetical protein
MSSQVTNISHTKWDTFFRNLVFTNSAWAVVDITGNVITMTIKAKVEDTAHLIQQNATLTDPTHWLAEIHIPYASMTLWIWEYYYDIQWLRAWIKQTIQKGIFNITYDIT